MQDFQNTFKFDEAVSNLSPSISDKLRALAPAVKAQVHEVRLRIGRPVTLGTGRTSLFLSRDGSAYSRPPGHALVVTREYLEESLRVLCEYSVHSHLEEIKQGFLPVRGGHRAGISGTAVLDGEKLSNLREITSINLRISRELPGCADILIRDTFPEGICGTLIAGAPGTGKTTLLRDIARQLSSSQWDYRKVAVVDERGEIASVFEGVPQCDVGVCTDVLNGYPKGIGMLTAIRTLSPQVLICDEIGSREEVDSVVACVNSGVTVISTIHASSKEELMGRPQGRALLETGAFQKLVFLHTASPPGQVAQILNMGGEPDVADTGRTYSGRGMHPGGVSGIFGTFQTG